MQETGQLRHDGSEDTHDAARAEAMMAAAGYSPQGGYADELPPDDSEPPPLTPQSRRRMIWGIALLVALGLAAVLPPLINVNRYQRRIATSISTSLGRPVHLDSVTLNLLPLPSFTLTNFVVSEDPSFGSEPVIRANSVKATLRIRSLWLRRVEFSRISLDDPSVNVVRRADGRWNLESILLQASRMPAEPTAQKNAGTAPRFPYIEATGGRVNLKEGLDKKAISLIDAEFALWLSEPNLWKLRLEAHPARTDTAATDTGTVRLDGTLGRAESLPAVPVDLHAEWSAVPLGAASWVLLGGDLGVRGDMNLRANIKGTVERHLLTTALDLHNLRRADFVPAQTLDVNINCQAKDDDIVHLSALKCAWPLENNKGGLTLTGDVPDLRHWQTAQLQARWASVPVSTLLNAMRVLSSRDSSSIRASGSFSGQLTCCNQATPLPTSGSFAVAGAHLALADASPIVAQANDVDGELNDGLLATAPIPLSLGGAQPASLTMTADSSSLRMRLTGTVLRSKLMELARALPLFGDGLEAALPPIPKPIEPKAIEPPMRIDLAAIRTWSLAQPGTLAQTGTATQTGTVAQTWTSISAKRAEHRR